MAWAREVNHANTTGIVFCYGACLPNIWLRNYAAVESFAQEAIAHAESFSLGLWHAWAQIYLGWALSMQTKASGIEEIEAGLKAASEIGARRLEPLHLSMAAEAYSRGGLHDSAIGASYKAVAALSYGSDMALAVDTYRTRALVLLAAESNGRHGVEHHLRSALEVAEAQQSPMLELRAACDLARLWVGDGEGKKAAALLRPIYDKFTEGFGTVDLAGARDLLNLE